jgi:hypothetical protein
LLKNAKGESRNMAEVNGAADFSDPAARHRP